MPVASWCLRSTSSGLLKQYWSSCSATASHDAMTASWVIQVLCCSWLSASMLVVMDCWTLADASSRYGEQAMKFWDHFVVRFASTFVQIACWHAGAKIDSGIALDLALITSFMADEVIYAFGSAVAVNFLHTSMDAWLGIQSSEGLEFSTAWTE